MKMAWLAWKDRLNQSYWFIPSLMAAASVAMAFLAIHLEHAFNTSMLGHASWVYTRDPQGARDLLATIGGSLITVTGVVFSVTLVALTNASAQYGSRILGDFARDTGNKVVLGAFVGTFLYCLLTMRTITGDHASFVPHLAVLLSILLAVLCFGLLIYFIHHLIEVLQFDNVVTELTSNLKATIDRIYPSRLGQSPKQANPALPMKYENNRREITATASGYIESIDSDTVMAIAGKNNLIVEVQHRPGDFIVSGARLAWVHPASNLTDQINDSLVRAFRLSQKRTYVQDVGFGFEQLQLVAIRALSPAVNNQILGMSCTDRIVESLVYLGQRDIPSMYRLDEQGQLRMIAEPISYEEAVHLAFSMVSEVAGKSPGVTEHLLLAIASVLEQVKAEELRAALFHAAQQLARRALDAATDDVGKAI
jgi:uncharacterized membrane protein